MRPFPIALCALLASTWAVPARGADADVAPSSSAPPYDAPAPAPGAEGVEAPVVPVVVKPALRVPPPAPQASDDEAPRARGARLSALGPEAYRPPEPGLVVTESLLGFLVLDLATLAALETTPWLIFAAPLATGTTVCLLGATSEHYDGSCASSIAGAYVGALALFPVGYLLSLSASSGGGRDYLFVIGAIVGYFVGGTAGAVYGWNTSRELKSRDSADVARLDAAAAARFLPWREPLRPRGSLLEASETRLTTPLLAFRF